MQVLGLTSPWQIVSCNFAAAFKSLELTMDFERRARFADPETGELCPVHDAVQRNWQHVNFVEHKTRFMLGCLASRQRRICQKCRSAIWHQRTDANIRAKAARIELDPSL